MTRKITEPKKLQLTPAGPGGAFLTRWSPDGKQIAFSGGDPEHPARLYVISAGGGTPRLLLGAEFNAVGPSWMPDGNSILLFDASGASAPAAVKMVNINTLEVTAIPDSKDVHRPVASPDGRYIAGASVDSQKLMLFDFSTRNWTDLLKMNVGWTSWSQDSKHVYFDTGLSENPAFYRVRVVDRKLERLADLKGFRRVVFAWIPWSGVTPDGAPLLLRDISSQEVYAFDLDTP